MLFAYFFVYETKGLSLEQVDRLFDESSPKESSKWKPHETFATRMGLTSPEAEVAEASEPKAETETV